MFSSNFMYLAQATDLNTGLVLTVVGMGIVFTVLVLIMIMLFSLQAIFNKQKKTSDPEPADSAAVTQEDDTTPEVMAVIAAAVAVAVGRPHKIRRVNLITQEVRTEWKGRGREKLHSSHRPKG